MGKKRKPTSKQALYSSLSCYADDVVSRLVKLTKSKNENVALGACKVLLNKTIPDIKSVEVTQSTILDHLIGSEQSKYEQAKPKSDKEFDAKLTPEERYEKGQLLIRTGQALCGIGKYRRREIVNDSIH